MNEDKYGSEGFLNMLSLNLDMLEWEEEGNLYTTEEWCLKVRELLDLIEQTDGGAS